MLTILTAIFPVFALIGLGALFGRTRKVGATGMAILNGVSGVAGLAVPIAGGEGLGAA